MANKDSINGSNGSPLQRSLDHVSSLNSQSLERTREPAQEDAGSFTVDSTAININEEDTREEPVTVDVSADEIVAPDEATPSTDLLDYIDDEYATDETEQTVAIIEGPGSADTLEETEGIEVAREELVNAVPAKISKIVSDLEVSLTTSTPADIFKGMVAAIAEAKKRARPEDRTDPVVEERLDLDQVATAGYAITEALHLEPENDANLCLISSTTIHESQKQPPGEFAQSIRPRSKLMFPWVHNSAQLKYASGYHLDDYDAAYNEAYFNAHIFLVIVYLDLGPLHLPAIKFVDSLPNYWYGRDDDYNLMKDHVRRAITNFSLVSPPHIVNHGVSTGASIPFESLEDLGWRERDCTQQNGYWQSGLHTILSAWAHAFELEINFDCRMEERRYRMVLDVVNLVLDGHATCPMVVGLLNAIGFVLPLNQGKKIRYFHGELKDTHNIRSTSSLNDAIIKERNVEANRLDWLIRTARYEDRPGEPGPKPKLKPIITKKEICFAT